MPLPYETATAGNAALVEVENMLRRLGATNFGVMSDWQGGATVIGFTINGRPYQMRASWKGYAAAWLRENPWSNRRRHSEDAHRKLAQQRGEAAVPSILRDWIKGQITAIECGIMTTDEAFLPAAMMPDGTRLIEHAVKMLPAPKEG